MTITKRPSTANGPGRRKAFQFIEGCPPQDLQIEGSDKENEKPKPLRETITISSPLRTSQNTTIQNPPNEIPPSTPATRLPLADLIGNLDDTCRPRKAADSSPVEQITWHALRSPRSSNPKKTPAPYRSARPRSSSPSSSSHSKKRPHASHGVESVRYQNLNQSLITPQTDPATELWNRYAVSSGKDGVAGHPAANLSNLLKTSSPPATDNHLGTVGGLRRWTSCGVEWPSSKAKRRKTRPNTMNEAYGASGPKPADILLSDAVAEAKKSRIGSLIERIHDSLTMPSVIEAEEPKGPSSSSPLPERSESFDRQSTSPTKAPAHPTVQAMQGNVVHESEVEDEKSEVDAKTIGRGLGSSSFGSDDLDLTEFDLPDVTVIPVIKEASPDGIGTFNRPPHEYSEHTQHGHPNPTLLGDPESNEFLDEDEFDEADELSMADFEAAASMFDGPTTVSSVKDDLPDKSMKSPIYSHAMEEPVDQVGDEFDDKEFDEESFVAAEAAATQVARTSNQSASQRDHRAIQRYLITNVGEGEYTASNGQRLPEKILTVEEDQTKLIRVITLRQSWYDTRCTKGSYVHIIGDFTESGQCLVDDAENMLILHPDHLISALVVADSFGCTRRAVLQDRIKATSEPSAPQIYGTMLHEIFQEALTANKWDLETLNDIIEKILSRHIEDLYEVKLSIAQARQHLESKLPELQAWAGIFVKGRPQGNGVVKDRKGKQVVMSINKLLDVEEHIWSPMYGLKGNIDATIQVVMQDDEGERVLTVPLEVKTGKNTTNTSHRAQTALYTLLLGDRYDLEVAYGILYYLESSEMSRIPAVRHELRHMVMQRNELACYIRERLSLPPMLKNTHTCNRCYAKIPCFLYHRLVEDGTGETSEMKEKFDEVVKHIKPSHQSFFKKWDNLLTKEESEMMKFRRELWTMLSTEREKLGRCFANVILEPGTASEDHGSSKINRFKYTFRKQEEALGFSFSESHLTVGEPIVISDEQGHYALARGYVTSIQKHYIGVAVDRRLHNARTKQPGFDAVSNQTFDGIMDVEPKHNYSSRSWSTDKGASTLYRLDKDEFSNGLATVRNNLVQIMVNDVFRARELRSLIIDNVEPRFKPTSTAYTLSGPLSQMNINEDQRAAIDKVMTAEDYALVLGMPGTGKTTTIAHIIRALVAKGKTVLLTSYTHTAVDNILLKIREDNISILRLGAIAKIHPEVREFAVLGAEPKTSIEELEKAYQSPRVVATTCLGINHPVFNERTFDYCIVDEASQITLPVCLGPIRMAKTFVLVGDHYQLPPLVQNREAQEGGLDVSLFKLLSEHHPSAVVTLHHQYRMNSEIMSLSNTLIYSGRLKCGTETIAKRRLVLPDFEALKRFGQPTGYDHLQTSVSTVTETSTCWIQEALGRDSSPVVFLNTDTLLPQSHEQAKGSRITNPLEARLISHLACALLVAGLPAESIGIITLYRSQLALIKSLLTSKIRPRDVELLEAHTADRFQGRDKDVVLLSCVRSNEREIVGDLLKDWRRVNVAVTRAKKKLVIVGSKGTLGKGDELLGKLIKLCEDQDWLIDLPASASDEEGLFGELVSTQGGFGPRVMKPDRFRGAVQHAATNKKASGNTTSDNKLATTLVPSSLVTIPDHKPSRAPLQPRTANNLNKAFKVPSKVIAASKKTVLGGDFARAKRPVLADIVNDVVGEDFFD